MTQESWREVRLGEVAKLEKQAWHPGDEELPYIGLEHIEEQTLRLKGVGNSSMVESNKFRFESGNILFGKLRPYFRKVVMPTFGGVCSTDIWVIAPKEQATSEYLFYLLANQEFIDLAYSSSSGTRMPRADWDFLSETVWPLPPLTEQKRIAEVLSSLDDKIDLLHRQNKTLEDTAQLLFRWWFLEDANPAWDEVALDEIANYLNGLACQKHPPKNDTDKLPVLKIKELKNGISDDSDWVTSDVEGKYIVKSGDVIFSWSGSLVVKIWGGETCVLNQHLFKITSEKYPKWYYYLWTKHHMQKFIDIADSKATTMGHIKREDLSTSLALAPPNDELNRMTMQISPIFDKITANLEQIQTLINLRDTLLPQLISGEVRVR